MLSNPRDRGTVLLLFPAAFLVMIILGAIVVDVGLSQVRGRELEAVAGSAANDALGSLDTARLRNQGEIAFDQAQAVAIAQAAVAAGPLPSATVTDVAITVDGAGRPQISVTLELDVELVVAPALPGELDVTTIRRTASATILG